MEHVAALLLIVGCSPNSAVCREIPVPQPIYRTMEACEAAKPLAVRLTGTFDSRVMASCAGLAQADLDGAAAVEWAVDRAGRLSVAVSEAPQLVASR